MKVLTLLLILILSLLLLGFLYLNQGLVTIQYWPGPEHQTPPLPLFAVIMLAIIAGVLMAGAVGLAEQLRLRYRLHQASRERDRAVTDLEKARLDADRALPEPEQPPTA
jgi:uncharacterized integral membrane protein